VNSFPDYYDKALSLYQNEDLALDLAALNHGKVLFNDFYM
jgi:hypothetical protein